VNLYSLCRVEMCRVHTQMFKSSG